MACSSQDGAATAGDEEATAENASELTTLAEVRLAGRGTVTFYEPSEGGVLIVRTGRERVEDAVSPGQFGNAARYFEAISGEPAPAALLEAIERDANSDRRDVSRLPADSDNVVAPVTEGPKANAEGVGTTAQALSNDLTHAQFQSTYCTATGAKRYNWVNVTGSGSFQWNGIHKFYTNLFATRGTVRFVAKYQPWYTWKDLFVGNVPQGWYQDVFYGRVNDFDGKASSSEADGDLYSFCSQAQN
jgi:hypothetical protein